jgi:hypothetical protein
MPATVVVATTEPADEGAILLVQEAAASIAVRAAEPRALPLPASEGPLLLKLDDLGLAVEGDSDLGAMQTASAHDGVVFQELAVGPVPRPSVTCSEGTGHRCERNPCSRAV